MIPILKRFAALVLCTCSFWGMANGQVMAQKQAIQKVTDVVQSTPELLRKDVDSAQIQVLAAKELLYLITSSELKAKLHYSLGDVYKAKGDLVASLNQYMKAWGLVADSLRLQRNDPSLQVTQSDIFLKIGSLYLQLKQLDKSKAYYYKALNILNRFGDQMPPAELALRKLKLYNNIAAVFIQQQDFKRALIYFQNALETNKVVKNAAIESTLLNNIGICYLEKREYGLASHYFQRALTLRIASQDKQGQAQVLSNIGKIAILKGAFPEAQRSFEKALALSREVGSKESALISLESLSTLNDTLKNYKASLDYFRQFKQLSDSIFNSESRSEIAALEDAQKRVETQKTAELRMERNEAERLKARIKFWSIVGVLVVLLLIAFWLIQFMRTRIKNAQLQQEKLTLEHQNLELERKTLQENLEFKDRELTANALFLLQNNELIARITDRLMQLKSSLKNENQHFVQEIIAELRSRQNNAVWEEFELHFTNVHSQFYSSLQEKFPNLTGNEKKLCAFLRLNMSTKDISSITGQSVNSITVARSRLRKKLNIEGEDIHLVNFLMEI